MIRVLITGANRGIGLEFVQQLLARGDRVFATCRRPDGATELGQLQEAHPQQLSVVALDVADPVSVQASLGTVQAETDGLDWLVNNAGVNYGSAGMGETRQYNALGHLDADAMLRMWRVNCVGPLLVTQAYLPLLRKGESPRVLNISSNQGSLANTASGGYYAYAASKTALNMLTRRLAFDLGPHGILAVAISPGWVKSDMGGSSAPLSAQESVKGMIELADGLMKDGTGQFWRWDGERMRW